MSAHTHKTGAELVMLERKRQIEKEGWSPKHDDQHVNGELVYAAVCYAVNRLAAPSICKSLSRVPVNLKVVSGFFGLNHSVEWEEPAWPWDKNADKRGKHDRIRSLAIAGALITAEIDRLLRKESKG